MMLILVEDRLTVHSCFLYVCMYIYGICQNEILTIVFAKQV